MQKETTQNKLFNFIITNSNIDDIQSRFISYKLELGGVKKIDSIISGKEYKFYTDNGIFIVNTVNLPIPITKIVKQDA